MGRYWHILYPRLPFWLFRMKAAAPPPRRPRNLCRPSQRTASSLPPPISRLPLHRNSENEIGQANIICMCISSDLGWSIGSCLAPNDCCFIVSSLHTGYSGTLFARTCYVQEEKAKMSKAAVLPVPCPLFVLFRSVNNVWRSKSFQWGKQ